MANVDRRAVLAGVGASLLAGSVHAADRIRIAAAPRGGSASVDDLGFRTAGTLAELLRGRKVSALELVEHLIRRIERSDPTLNAVVVRDFDRAREAARAADRALARREAGPLLGVPMTVKESYNVAGLATTWGIPQQARFMPTDDAVVVARLKNAGAIVLGKTNVPLMLGDWQAYNEIYGTTNNPWDTSRTPGGSSGGCAAALAAGFTPLSMGSDIGGSLRVPAHFCGVFGHKPTLGLVPVRGQNPPPFPALPRDADLDVVGPMARSANDLALALDVVAGPDELSAGVGYRLALPPARHGKLGAFRALVLETHPLVPSAQPVRTAIERLADRLAKAGVKITRASPLLPDLAESARLYMRLLMSVMATSWPPALLAQAQARAATLPKEDRSLSAERVHGAVLTHRDWMIADSARRRLREQWRLFYRDVDVVLCPPMPVVAFAHDHSPFETRRLEVDGTVYPYSDVGLVWADSATTGGLPATVMPIDQSEEGLPIGVQIVGPFLEDRTTLAFAALVEREFGGFVAPPVYAA